MNQKKDSGQNPVEPLLGVYLIGQEAIITSRIFKVKA